MLAYIFSIHFPKFATVFSYVSIKHHYLMGMKKKQEMKVEIGLQMRTYFEHRRTTIFATGDSSCIQFLSADGDSFISSNSS